MRFSEKQKGVFLMLLSALSFSAMQAAVSMSDISIGTMEQVFFRNSISFIIALVLIKRNNSSFFGSKEDQPALFWRSFLGFLGVVFGFYAVRNANQVDVTILNKLSPFFTTLLSVIFLKEKLAKIQVPALIIAFSGAFIVIGPSFDSNFFPLFLAFLSAVSSGITYTLLRYFKGRVDGLTVIMHFSTFSMIASLPFILGNLKMPSPHEFLLLLLIGVFGSLGQIAITYSYRLAPASEVSIYNYSGIIFSMLFGYYLLNQNITIYSVAGGILVILASFLVYFFGNKDEKEC